MKLIPECVECDACDEPATAELVDTTKGTTHRFCSDHQPDLWPGKNSHWQLIRYRSPPGNAVSQLISAPEGSSEHQSFRREMCETQLLGGEGACRYYLSRLTDSDQFSLWQNEFLDNVREFVAGETNGAAASIPIDLQAVSALSTFFKRAFEERFGGPVRQTKQEKAVELLLHHPDWSDEKIAEAVPTTLKQLARNSDYFLLRRQIAHRRKPRASP